MYDKTVLSKATGISMRIQFSFGNCHGLLHKADGSASCVGTGVCNAVVGSHSPTWASGRSSSTHLGSSTGSVVVVRSSVPWNSGLIGSTIVPGGSPGLFLGSPSILHCLFLGISEVLPSTVGIVLSRVSWVKTVLLGGLARGSPAGSVVVINVGVRSLASMWERDGASRCFLWRIENHHFPSL